MAKTLIIRHHRIGDALIALPLIISLANKYKEDEFTVISNKRFKSLFEMMPENVTYIPMVVRKSSGMFRGVSFLFRRWFFIKKDEISLSAI
ncbi:MAG: hypothetical protein LIO65_03280 [Odoribacter sp.]|nr:hypothetical protein [Odoribacter sp.]